MKTKQFLDLVLGHKGNYCVFAVNADADKKKQKFYTSVDHVIDAARDFDSNGYDAYFSLATLEEAGSRKADNVQSFRSFFLDLDCGEGDNKFASQAVAVKALQKFCKQHKLPKPTLVNSGRGVHVYWILDAPVGKDDWLTTALRLKKLCAKVTPLPLYRFLAWKNLAPRITIRFPNWLGVNRYQCLLRLNKAQRYYGSYWNTTHMRNLPR